VVVERIKTVLKITIMLLLFGIILLVMAFIPTPIQLEGEISLEGNTSFNKFIEQNNLTVFDDLELNKLKASGSMRVYVPYYWILTGKIAEEKIMGGTK
jgi:hypothetical protein